MIFDLTMLANEFHRIESSFRQFFAIPPSLKVDYSRDDYFNFFQKETEIFSKKYAKERVIIHGRSELMALAENGGAVLAPIHHGSFFLSGGVFVHQLGLNCNAIVTHKFGVQCTGPWRNFMVENYFMPA